MFQLTQTLKIPNLIPDTRTHIIGCHSGNFLDMSKCPEIQWTKTKVLTYLFCGYFKCHQDISTLSHESSSNVWQIFANLKIIQQNSWKIDLIPLYQVALEIWIFMISSHKLENSWGAMKDKHCKHKNELIVEMPEELVEKRRKCGGSMVIINRSTQRYVKNSKAFLNSFCKNWKYLFFLCFHLLLIVLIYVLKAQGHIQKFPNHVKYEDI